MVLIFAVKIAFRRYQSSKFEKLTTNGGLCTKSGKFLRKLGYLLYILTKGIIFLGLFSLIYYLYILYKVSGKKYRFLLNY